MSAVELIKRKVQALSEHQAQSVLEYIERLETGRAPTARELMRMPRKERDKILAAQAESAAKLYRENPELIVEDVDPPLDYE